MKPVASNLKVMTNASTGRPLSPAEFSDAVRYNREQYEQQLSTMGYRPGPGGFQKRAAPRPAVSTEQKIVYLQPVIEHRLNRKAQGLSYQHTLDAGEQAACKSAGIDEVQLHALVEGALQLKKGTRR